MFTDSLSRFPTEALWEELRIRNPKETPADYQSKSHSCVPWRWAIGCTIVTSLAQRKLWPLCHMVMKSLGRLGKPGGRRRPPRSIIMEQDISQILGSSEAAMLSSQSETCSSTTQPFQSYEASCSCIHPSRSKASVVTPLTHDDDVDEVLEAKVKALLAEMDLDGDGVVTRAETHAWLEKNCPGEDADQILFQMDSNSDGVVQIEELREWTTSYIQMLNPMGSNSSYKSILLNNTKVQSALEYFRRGLCLHETNSAEEAEVPLNVANSAPTSDDASPSSRPEGPLCGITVVDLTRVLSGPYCTMLMADNGARVIKVEVPERGNDSIPYLPSQVEVPERGDDSRMFGPYLNGHSVYFQAVNRGKESIALNLKSENDISILRDMLSHADVLVENFRPGVMSKLGLSWEDLHRCFPHLIQVSISGYGQVGPDTLRPCYDIVAQGEGGIMSITGFDHTPPTRVGVSIGDIGAGLYAMIGAQAALIHRSKTGRGMRVDVAMLDVQLALMNQEIAAFLATGVPPKKLGSRHASIAPFEAFPTLDGHVVIAGGNNSLFKTIAEALGQPGWVQDERFKTNSSRVANIDALVTAMTKELQRRPTSHWVHLLDRAGVPCSAINDLESVVSHPQTSVREMLVTADHDIMGQVKMVGNAIKFSEFPESGSRAPAPVLDQHRNNILSNLARE